MEFRVKDLMIAVVPKEAELAACLWRTRICLHPTFCRFASCFHLTCLGPTCGFHSCFGVSCVTNSCGLTFCHHISCQFATCNGPTCLGCTALPSQCGPAHSCVGGFSAGCPGGLSIACPGFSGDPPIVIQRVEDIKALREELTLTLRQLDEVEKVGLGPQPQTAQEAEALAQKLEEALKELRSWKPEKK